MEKRKQEDRLTICEIVSDTEHLSEDTIKTAIEKFTSKTNIKIRD